MLNRIRCTAQEQQKALASQPRQGAKQMAAKKIALKLDELSRQHPDWNVLQLIIKMREEDPQLMSDYEGRILL